MKKWLVSSLLITIVGCSGSNNETPIPTKESGITLIESVTQDSGQNVIPYSKYRLDNGLTVILSPDHSDPLVHVDVTYHVGSAREDVGKSGFAHFFEHMMFQGSDNVGDQEHFRLITEAGGTLNGTTNRDRTNYFETVPANELEKMLWLESDRMGFLIDAVSQKKFEIQRSTVKNERAQNYDNRPYGLMYERIGQALYPLNHPYSWQTIGYVEDLDRVDVNDLKAFFLRWYGPNNAVITIGGDIDTEQTLAWVKKYFGSIPKGPEVENAEKQPAVLTEDRFITLEDNIQQPLVMMAYPTSYRGAEGEANIDMLASTLGQGKNSLLYQELVKTGKTVDAGAFHDCAELSCTLYVYAMADSGEESNLATTYQQLQQVLNLFGQQGVTAEDITEIKGSAEAGAIFGLQSVKGKVSQLASNETFYSNPNRLATELAALRAVKPKDVMDAFQRYVEGQHSVVLSVVPKGKSQLEAHEVNFTPPQRSLPEYQKISDDELHVRKGDDDFDRSIMPQPSQPVEPVAPTLYRTTLKNGIKVLGTVASETPTIELNIVLPAGNRYVPIGKEGLADLTAALMQEDTRVRSVEEIEKALGTLGSSISVDTGLYSTTISIASLTKNIDATLAIAEEMLFKPAMNAADFDRLKKQSIEGLVYEQQKPAWLASQATRQVLFSGSSFARSSDGTMASLQGITLEDVKQFYQQHYSPEGSYVVAVGDIALSPLKEKLAFLQDWEGNEPKMLAPQQLPNLSGQAIYLVDKPDAPQSVIRLARQGMRFDATGELYKTKLANFNLAGNFNSRINQNLREDKGYTYGAGGYLSGTKELGSVVFYAQVRADVTGASVAEFLKELTAYSKEGVTKQELAFMRLAVGQQEALSYETPGQKAGLLSQMMTYSLDKDFIEQRNNIVATISKSEIDELSKKWFEPSKYQIIVVGDKKTVQPQLESLGIEIHSLNVDK
ncbi:M16 family metallopeptidase [Aliivibrio kagoshimensis]|uniref:M16 family metallopeptidase n=1 Tax=Aliivibrio kagoshimensis TaxID=2910230 RepID=UPI003D1170AE